MRTVNIKWPVIITHLRATFTQKALARELGVSKTSIANLATGRTEQPRFGLGAGLLLLHKKYAADKHKDIIL